MERIEPTEKIESAIGQAPTPNKKTGLQLMRFLKSAKEAQLKKQEQAAFFTMLKATQAERDTIRRNLNFITDADCAEICIYRLKAAELDLSRHIRQAKAANFTVFPGLEEAL